MTENARARLEKLLKNLQDGADSELASEADYLGVEEEDRALLRARAGDAEPSSRFSEVEVHYKHRITMLEQRLTELASANAKAHLIHEGDLRAKDALIQDLQRQVEEEVADVRQRQHEVEQRAPVLSRQVADAKEQLSEVSLSHAAYSELAAKPREQRSLADEVRLVTYEGLAKLKHENDALRSAAQANREAYLAIEQDVTTLKRENVRLKAAASDATFQATRDVESMAARVERLQHELGQAAMAAEVNHAKGQLYDELAAHAAQLEHHNQRLVSSEAIKTTLEGELASMQSAFKEREHRLELLMMDKAYLTKEVESLEARCKRLTDERDQQAESINDMKKQQTELYAKLLVVEDGSKASLERRVEMEVARVQSAALADLEKVRAESRSASEREGRMLREMREHALAELDRSKAELKSLQGAHEALLLQHRELQRAADVESARLATDLHRRAGEADRLVVEVAEKDAMLQRSSQQVDMLNDKVRVLTENYYTLEAERARRVAELQAKLNAAQEQVSHYQSIEADLDKAVLAGGSSGEPSTLLQSIGNVVPASVKRRVQQSLALAARCSALEAERRALSHEKQDLERALQIAQVDLAKYKGLSMRSGPGPNAFLLEELSLAEVKATSAEDRAARLQRQLDEKAAEAADAHHKLSQMHHDLQVVLDQRNLLDSVKAALSTASTRRGVAASGSHPARRREAPPVALQR